jgi:hypothetical protein
MPLTRITELAEKILEREKIYDAAFRADLDLMKKLHGHEPVREALQLLAEAPPPTNPSKWNQRDHAARVRAGIGRFLFERRIANLWPD